MQNNPNRIIEFLRDVDWWLAVCFDRVAIGLQRDIGYIINRHRTQKHRLFQLLRSIDIRGLDWTPLMRRIVPKFISARAACVVTICFCLGWIISVAPPAGNDEFADQPINHIYQKVDYDFKSILIALNPIGSADAALPKSGDDRAFDDSKLLSNGDDDGLTASDAATSAQKTVRIGRGQTLNSVLKSLSADPDDIKDAVAALKKIFDPKNLDRDEDVVVDLTPYEDQGPGDRLYQIDQITFTPTHDKRVIVTRNDDGKYRAKFESRPVEVRINAVTTIIAGSISASAKKAGLPKSVLSEVTRVLSYDIDFQREVHPGDKLEVVFEEIYDEDGNFVKYGSLLSAGLKYGQKEFMAYRYKPSDDAKADYFDANGRSVRKALLRTPVDGAKITAGFGMRRHPILGYSKMHEGVDFGAPMGTPVIAAGDGVVVDKSWNGGYGHYVEIQHNREYATAYGHLSRYHPNLRVGQRVHQGDIIGYVGSTGLSTGPHLHYEVHRGARKINPVGVRFATGRQLAGKELQKFKLATADIRTKLANGKKIGGDKIAAK